MKIPIFSDLHCHSYRDFARTLENGRNSRLQHTLNVLKRVRKYAVENKCDHVLFGGDLFHKKGTIAVSLLQAVYEEVALFKQKGVKLVLTVGNHDQAAMDGKIHAIKTFEEVATVVDEPETYVLQQDNEQCAIRVVPYMEDAAEFKKALKPDSKHVRLLLAHGAINGAVTGPVEYQPEHPLEVGDVPDSYEFRFFGHYHRRQKMGPQLWYIGSPMQHTRGEAGELEKGFIVYDTETRKFKNVPLEMPEFVTIDLSKVNPKVVKGNFVDVEYDADSDNIDEIVDRLKKLGAEAVNPVPIFKEKKAAEKRLDVDPSMSPRELVKKYVEAYTPKGMDKKSVLERALALMEQAA